MEKYKKIAIVCAMRGEAQPIIEQFDLKEQKGEHGLIRYSSQDETILLSLNGVHPRHQVDCIGTDAAAVNTYTTVYDFKPDIILNCGTAGGFDSMGAGIGEVYLGYDKIIFHDRRIPIGKSYQDYALGSFPTFDVRELASSLNLKTGVISTGNSLDYSEFDWNTMNAHKATLKDMEAAAIASACDILDTPLICVKSVTDLVDKEQASSAFVKNFDLAISQLCQSTTSLIETIKA